MKDRSVRVGKRAKQIFVGYFVDERACADAVVAKKAEIDASIAVKLHAIAQALPHTRGLPLMPAYPADAEPEMAYYGEKRHGAKGASEARECREARRNDQQAAIAKEERRVARGEGKGCLRGHSRRGGAESYTATK